MSGRTWRILVVEDNSADVYLLRKALKDAGLTFELQVIEDGAQALAFVRGDGEHRERAAPDLMVLDLNLPKNGGTEVLAALRQIEAFARVPIVVTSSSSSPGDRAKAEQFRTSRYIVKPADLGRFLEIGQVLKEILLEL